MIFREFARGAYAGLPIVLGYLPVAFSFGVAASRAGFSLAEASLFSALMYSGAGQFMAIALLAAQAPFALVVITLFAMALRHAVYGPSLLQAAGAPRLGALSPVWGFGLTDEVFGTALGALSRGLDRFSDGFMMGLAFVAWAAWGGGTAAGAFAGAGSLEGYPMINAALGFMLPALFLALLLSLLSREYLGVVCAAGVGTLLGALLFNGTVAILLGMGAGAIWGVVGREEKK